LKGNTMAIVTYEAVAAAAEALQAAGQRPSVRAVTAAIGGGSPNTVLKMLADWKAGRPVVRVADTELDPKITSAIAEQMQRVATDDDLQALAEAHAQSEKQIATLTTERDAALAQVAELVEALKEAQADAKRERENAAAERQRQEAMAAALTRAEVRLEALPTMQDKVEQQQAALATESNARVTAEQQAAVLAAKLEAMTYRATRAETEGNVKQAPPKTVKTPTKLKAKPEEQAELLPKK
jgi:colicin import membrane protein